LEVQYHPGALPEANITASPSEFATMADRIAELTSAGTGAVVFPAAAGRGLLALVVRIGSGLVVVAREDEVLSVRGGLEAVGLFARNLPSEVSLPPGYHIHFEHVGREWFVAPESVPLVMVVGSAQVAEPRAAPAPAT
jgi:hypothetical protein